MEDNICSKSDRHKLSFIEHIEINLFNTVGKTCCFKAKF